MAQNGTPLRAAAILIVGVSYKPGVADVRGSPALEILSALRRLGANAQFYDPLVPEVRCEGHLAHSVTHPEGTHHDLVLLHTLHPKTNYGWLRSCPLVLDATYRCAETPLAQKP
jgi:UDP-N-acetyl-D-mannosaminuronate dehydrogenase